MDNYGNKSPTSGPVLAKLSEFLNAPVDGLCLFLSLLIGFPLALIHRHYFYGKNPQHQHYFFIACGFSIGFLNYIIDYWFNLLRDHYKIHREKWNFITSRIICHSGYWNFLHSTVAVLVTYLTLRLCGGKSRSVLICFIFNMIYLLWGYYTTATNDYDIKWTMPQCVLTLRLIGLAFDHFDGNQSEKSLSETQKTTALHQLPSLVEVAAFAYFPGSFLVGPQFSIRRYLDFVNGKLVKTEADSSGRRKAPNSLMPGIYRASLGFLYIFMYQIGTHYISDSYLLDAEFQNIGFLKRCFLLGLWARCNLYKYISCWLIAEGICIAFGLTYNGTDEKGQDKWDGCANVKLITFENATEFNHYILSFNTNTNHWVAEYIYKRCKFLGSKLYSQLATLLFLAIWHGFHSGYYACFFMEFIIMYFEKDFKSVLLKNNKLQGTVKESFLIQCLIWLVLKVYTFVFMGYSLIPFVLLSYSRYIKVYANFYFMGHVIFLSYPILAPYIKKALRPQRERQHTD